MGLTDAEAFVRDLAATDWDPDDLQRLAVNVRHSRILTLEEKRDGAAAALTLKAAILKAREFYPQ